MAGQSTRGLGIGSQPVTMRNFSAQDAPCGKPAATGSSRWLITTTARGPSGDATMPHPTQRFR